MRLRRFLLFLAWSLAAWIAMAGAAFGLRYDLVDRPEWWRLILPAVLVVTPLWCVALRAGGGIARPWRVGFWVVKLAGAALCVLLMDWQWAGRQWDGRMSPQLRNLRGLVAVAAILPVLVALLLWTRNRRNRSAQLDLRSWDGAEGRWWADAAMGAGLLVALTVVGSVVINKFYAPHVTRITDERWAAIGRSMPEFEKQFHRVEENASLRELTKDLEPFGIYSFYKPRSNEADPNTMLKSKALGGVLDSYAALWQVKGDVIPSIAPASMNPAMEESIAKGTQYLDSHAADFERLYQGILHREPPVWSYDPADGWQIRVPNYVANRELSQLIVADAGIRLQRGDVEGVRTAATAYMRISDGMGRQPILVSEMIHISTEGLLAQVMVRLPAEPDAMKNLAAEAQAEREQFRSAIQGGCSLMMHWEDRRDFNPQTMFSLYAVNPATGLSPITRLREWLVYRFGHPMFRIQMARDYLVAANEIGITQRVEESAKNDLGTDEMDRLESGYTGLFLPSIHRAWLRMNAFLLLREQTEIIRMARAGMEAGKAGELGPVPSVVIPGCKWVVTGDAATNSVTLKLDPVPRWVAEKEVTGDEFFLLPVDGSKSWKFAPVARRTAAGW